MHVAIDDTDSQNHMCTTYIISEIISKKKYDIIGYPELVRLNPNIKYKTRGNGALNINLGKGTGKRTVVGKSGNEFVYSYEKMKEEADPEELMDFVYGIVEDYYVKNEPGTNPGIVISDKRFPDSLYYKALEEEISIDYIEKYLNGIASYRKIGSGHGIIGSAASLAWNHRRSTYELLAYKYPEPEKLNAELKMELASIPEQYNSTFNNIDLANNYPAIFPKPKTPVIFGIRGINSQDLIMAYSRIKQLHDTGDSRFVIYSTNQGTDDHIIFNPNFLMDLSSYAVTGVINSYPETIEGGHTFIGLKYKEDNIKLAAFEPTKEFRSIIRQLIPGDIVTAYGSYINKTIKLEKIRIIEIAKLFRSEPPICPICNVKTRTKGKLDYRCPSCRRRYKTPLILETPRTLSAGFYEVPVIARRHLSMPLKLYRHFYNEPSSPDNDGAIL
ncbi:MAG: tRNA(Ile)(2)-agmatinylcytidine synthase [Ferroplasma sp.]